MQTAQATQATASSTQAAQAFQIKSGFVKSKVGGQHVVVPVGDMSIERHCMIRLNGTGSFLWDYLQKPATLDDMVSAVCERYDVERPEARADCEAFVEALRASDLLGE